MASSQQAGDQLNNTGKRVSAREKKPVNKDDLGYEEKSSKTVKQRTGASAELIPKGDSLLQRIKSKGLSMSSMDSKHGADRSQLSPTEGGALKSYLSKDAIESMHVRADNTYKRA